MMSATDIKVHLRWLVRQDLPAVMTIEAAGSLGWTEDELLRTLREENCIGNVAEFEANVVGYFVYEVGRTRMTLTNLVVHPSFRRAGVGRAMVEKLKTKVCGHRRNLLVAYIRETNLDGQRFLAAMGLKAVKVRRGFFADTGEDAYRMEWRPEPL